eukprot:4982857-Prorocentrum_lima.AAC.1
MTSSLVGSEMCIRDSQTLSTHHQGEYLPRELDVNHGPYRRAANGASPVSYTHLTLPTICSV